VKTTKKEKGEGGKKPKSNLPAGGTKRGGVNSRDQEQVKGMIHAKAKKNRGGLFKWGSE